MLSQWIVATYRAIAEFALWISILVGAVIGGGLGAALSAAVDTKGLGFLGVALGAMGGFAISSTLLGATLLLIDMNASLRRMRDDAMNRVLTVAPGFTVSTGAAIAKAIDEAKDDAADSGRAYAPPAAFEAPAAPAEAAPIAPAAPPMPAAPRATPTVAPSPRALASARIAIAALCGIVLLCGVFLLFKDFYDKREERERPTDEATLRENADIAAGKVSVVLEGNSTTEQTTPVADHAPATPTAAEPSEPTTTSEDDPLNPQWFGTWSAEGGSFRIEIDASGFTFHVPGDDVVAVRTYRHRWGANRAHLDEDGRYATYVKPSLTREEILARYKDYPPESLSVLAALRPGKYRVVVTPSNDAEKYPECVNRYVLDENNLFQFDGCGGMELMHYERQ